MAYQGYRIKVNSVEIENTLMVRGSYSMTKVNRVLASYYDAAGTYHEELDPVSKTEIEFTIREHSMEEHEDLMDAFSGRNVNVEFFDDTDGTYKTGVFRVEDKQIPHTYAVTSMIRYGEIDIKMKEN